MNSSDGLTRRALFGHGGRLAGGLAFAALGGSPLLLSACGNSSDPEAADGSTGGHIVSVPDLDNVYWQSWKSGAEAAALALGITSSIQSYKGAIEQQINALSKPGSARLALAFPQNAAASPKVVEAANRAGLTICTSFGIADYSTPVEPAFGNAHAAFFSPEEVEGSRLMASAVFAAVGNKGKVIHISGIPGEVAGEKRSLGVQKALDEHRGMQLVARENGGESRVGTRPVIEALLTKNPDVDVIVCHNDDSAIAVLNVLQERGMKDVKVGGIDALDEFLDAMRNGPNAQATVAIHGAWLAGFAVARAYDIANGVQVDPLERMLYQDSLVIDSRESAKAYQDLIYKSESLPFDWRKMSRKLNPSGEDTQIGLQPMDPDAFFQILGGDRPDGYSFPEPLQKSLDSANLDALQAKYRDAVQTSPLTPVVALTGSRKTVLGFS